MPSHLRCKTWKEWNISPSLDFPLFKDFSSIRFSENPYFGGLLISKKLSKICGLKVAFKQGISVCMVQNEAVVVFVEPLKRGNIFWDTGYIVVPL